MSQSVAIIITPCIDPGLGKKSLVEPLPTRAIRLQKWLIGKTKSLAGESAPEGRIEPKIMEGSLPAI